MEQIPDSQLRVSELEALKKAAQILARGPAFVVIVCAPDLTIQARNELQGMLGRSLTAAPVESNEEMLDRLIQAAQSPEGSAPVVLTIEGDLKKPITTLNLHREKVLAGAPVILWLRDVDELNVLRQVAPDTFSFRNTLVIVEGDGGAIIKSSAEEPDSLVSARRKVKRAKTALEKAQAALTYVQELRQVGQVGESLQVAEECLAQLGTARLEEEEQAVRVHLLLAASDSAGMAGFTCRRWAFQRSVVEESQQLPLARGLSVLLRGRAALPGPFARDLKANRLALDEARRWGAPPDVHSAILNHAAFLEIQLGNLPRATQILQQAEPLLKFQEIYNRAVHGQAVARIAAMKGQFAASMATLQNLSKELSMSGKSALFLHRDLTWNWFYQGELRVAEARLYELALNNPSDAERLFLECLVASATGQWRDGLVKVRSALKKSATEKRDGDHLALCKALHWLVSALVEAGQLAISNLSEWVELVDGAQEESFTMTAPDAPPWYGVEFRLLRAQLRALDPRRVAAAKVLAQEAFEDAKRTYPDLTPQNGHLLAGYLVKLDEPDNALQVLSEVEPMARSNGMLKDLAAIQVTRIQALVQKQAPSSEARTALETLRGVLREMDSPRYAGEYLLGLAISLPGGCTEPDVIVLSQEAALTFFDLPMPENEARAYECIGDAWSARANQSGDPTYHAEAARYYNIALKRLKQFGFGLRIPLLEKKLAICGGQS
ncbi:MAG: hypothetical protein IPK82_03975 [Polyangiaceae bacterium]|nr:hypothetical protein [Polyangiaceae bacterium]